MKFECDNCGNPATFHITEIQGGKKVEKHLCEECAAAEGIAVKHDVPIEKLLEEFVNQSPDPACPVCGMSYAEFRKHGLLGCPNDYDAFEDLLARDLERVQEGTQHVGKAPQRPDGEPQRQTALLRMRAELKRAVSAEDYERAAVLRDQIKEMEGP